MNKKIEILLQELITHVELIESLDLSDEEKEKGQQEHKATCLKEILKLI